MTSKPVLLSIVVCVWLSSCQQPETSDDNTPTESLINTSVYPVQPMQLIAPANLRLSYTGRTATDSSVFYQVIATYKGETYGFNLSVPKGEEGTAYLSSRGKISDDLLHFIQALYGRPVDTTTRFGGHVPAGLLSLGALVTSDSVAHPGSDSAARDSVAHPGSDSASRSGTHNKLLFRDRTTGDSSELYLDVNEKEHWIGLNEKDTVYRARLIRALMQQ